MSIFDKYDLIDVDESFPIPELPEQGLILLVGTSGSGKSTILRNWLPEEQEPLDWSPQLALYEEFSSPENAEKLLISCGLRTIPAWRRPITELSNGEKHRAEIARSIDLGRQSIDEFSSVVDRDTAKALSVAISKFYKSGGIGRLVIATVHRDVIEWLQPDAIYDTDAKRWLSPKERLRRPKIQIDLVPCETKSTWELFKKHHYLSGNINKGAYSWVALISDKPIGFVSILRYPSGTVKNAWRGHRTVVLPEFQGMGIGSKISETVASFVLEQGGRFFSKTSHPSLGEHRERSELWKPTSKNKKKRTDYTLDRKTKEDGHKMLHANRVCYSHEYIGSASKRS